MPGLAGVVSNGKPFLEPHAAIRAFTTVGLVNGVKYTYRSYCDRNAAILNTLTGLIPGSLNQPATDGSAYLFLEGEVANIDEVRRRTGCPSTTPVCDSLLALFRSRGAEFVLLLNGEFNIAIWSKRDRRLDLFCDQVASTPMYCIESAGSFLFGSEKKFLLSALSQRPPALDPLGLLQIVTHHHNLAGRTFLAGVERLQGGAHVTYTEGSVRIRHNRNLVWSIPSRKKRPVDLCAEWAERLTNAIHSRVVGKEGIFLSLSGGLDSRALACAFPSGMPTIASRTRAAQGSLEGTIAAAIAARFGFDHQQEDPSAVPPSTIIPRIAWRTECETPFMNGLGMSHHSVIRDRCQFLMGGWLGDVSSGQRIATPMLRPQSRDVFIREVFNRYCVPREALAKVFTRQFLAAWLPHVEEEFWHSFRELQDLTNVQAYETWDIYHRQARQTNSSMHVDSHLFEKIRPFYDTAYLQFTMMLPTRLRYGQVAYQCMIWNQGKLIRDLQCANNGLRLRRTVSGNRANKVLTAARRALERKVGGILPSYGRALKRRSEDLGAAMRDDPGFSSLIEGFLASADCDDAVFNREGIRGMLSEHHARAADHTYLLGHVATLAAGLPYFLRGTQACPPEAEPLEPVTDVRTTINLSAEQAKTVFG